MNVRTLIQKTATATAFAAMAVFAGACSHNKAAGDYGHVDNSQAGMTSSTNQADTAVNNNGDVTTTPAVTTAPVNANPIPGPAKVDSSGNAYTSSSAPGTGNASIVGTNTNVNNIPKGSSSSNVTYTEAQTVQTTTPTVVETPAPVVTTPTITETQTTTTETVPMTSSTTEQTTSSTTTNTTTESTAPAKHKRMRKD